MFLKKFYLFILLHVSERDYRYMCDTDAYVEVRGQLRPSPLLKQGPSCFSYFHLPSCFRSGITHVFMWVPGVKLRLFRLVQLALLPMEASSWPWCVFFDPVCRVCVLIGILRPLVLKVTFGEGLLLFMVVCSGCLVSW